MAENIPSVPPGAVPPKKETGKVQPKKETVRINLPPKPSAAPTIKLPSMPPGGAVAAGAPAAAPAPATASATTATRATPAPVAQPRPVTAAPAAAAKALSPIDNALAIAAAVVALIVVGSVLFLMTL